MPRTWSRQLPERGAFYTQDEMALISRISNLVIPRTETPGALDANVPGYLDALMSDWASAEPKWPSSGSSAHFAAPGQSERRLQGCQ